MEENEILTKSLIEFYDINDGDKNKMENAVECYENFYDFIEDNPKLKDKLYGFFYKLFDDFVTFKFYDKPIPALIENKEYMKDYQQKTKQTASTFFNFGGMTGVKQ